jgi:hypothetical protein
MGGQGLDAPAFKYERNAQCASGVAAATACEIITMIHVHDGRAADVPAAALADGEDVRESAAAAPLLSVVGGKMGVTLYRPATFLHAWHDFETECVVWRNLYHRRFL